VRMFPEPGQGRYRWRGGAKPKDFADGSRGCRMPAERRCVEIGQAARFEPELLAAPALGPLPGARTGKVGVLQRACLGGLDGSAVSLVNCGKAVSP